MDLQLLNIFSKITPRSQAIGGKATNKGKQMSQIITDAELISIMNGTNKNGKQIFLAHFEPRKHTFPQMDARSATFHADTKAEAERLAKEYGRRILDRRLAYLVSCEVEELRY
jgi:hypothetical protein